MKAMPPLLMLAEGRKPRPRKAPKANPREIALHMRVAATLRKHACPEWAWAHIPNGERRDKRTAGKLKQMGVKAGWPDFILVSPRGLLHALELKREGEELSEAQKEFRFWCIRHSVPFVIAYRDADVMAAFTTWRCLMNTPTKETIMADVPYSAAVPTSRTGEDK